MLYQLYQAQSDTMTPWRLGAEIAAAWAGNPALGLADTALSRSLVATRDLMLLTATSHYRPAFALPSVTIGNREVAVHEETAGRTPFATLINFRKEGITGQPKLLIVAPMSGHFSTLLRATIRTALPDNDVYITDWHNARDVPAREGTFDLDDFTDHVMRFLRVLGPRGHVLAVCQPAVSVLAAAALMAEDGDPATPRTMTLLAGPIDTRVNPTKVNELAQSQTIDWIERNLITTVPWRQPGAGRRVYPSFLQVMAFMAMNPERHQKAHRAHWDNVLDGNEERVAFHRAFYREYMAVMDLPAEFYLQTIAKIFQLHELPLGVLHWRGRKVDPSAIRHTALLTVEGELDDICSIGQTMAALDLCSRIPMAHKRHHLQTGVGHYGTFSGRRWSSEIYPLVREFIQIYAT
jgi:poly(3-hydroxybutyrate) depolymerase